MSVSLEPNKKKKELSWLVATFKNKKKFLQYTQLLKFFPRDGPGPLREFYSLPVAGSWKGSHTPVKGLFFWEIWCKLASYPY